MTGARGPGVLFIVFDCLGAGALARLADRLPALTRLRARGQSFTNAYACAVEGAPARASLLTGLDIATHGVWTDGVALPQRETTLPQVFARHGYHTWLVGRRHLAGLSHWTTEHARQGEYHHFDWAHGPLHRSRQNAYLTWLEANAPSDYARIFPVQANPDDTGIPAPHRAAMAALPDDLSFNAWVGAQALARLAGQGAGPFLGIAGFVVGNAMGAPDPTNPCAEELNERALLQADAAIGALVDAVPPGTEVVVTSGHGAPTTHGDPLQEAAVKVPLILCGPNHAQAEVTVPVSTLDIAPTLYETAGIVPPQRMQGQSLRSHSPRGWAFTRLRHPDLPHQTALRTSRWKLVMTHPETGRFASPTYRLYDLADDPHAALDLANRPACQRDLEDMIDLMIDTRVALEDRTEPRIAAF